MIAPVLHFSRAEFEQRIKITRQEMEAAWPVFADPFGPQQHELADRL